MFEMLAGNCSLICLTSRGSSSRASCTRLVSYSKRTGDQGDTDDFTEFYDSSPENLFRRLVDIAASVIIVVCKNGCWTKPPVGCVLTSVSTSITATPSSVVTHVFFVVEKIYKKIQFQVVVVVVVAVQDVFGRSTLFQSIT